MPAMASLYLLLAHIISLTFASPGRLSPSSSVVVERQSQSRGTHDPQCTHGPNTRACWSDGYSIDTDFDKKWPTTGNTVSYTLEITNGTCNPDGHGKRLCFLVNGQYPGPTIQANWGDDMEITVRNKLQDNGTSVHWHGFRQYYSVGYDGVNGITECPLAPGDERTYYFQATQYGTSWYHSHFSSQYGEGVIGPMLIEGPATANYDIDLNTYMLTDWFYLTTFQVNSIAFQNLQHSAQPPPGDNLLINGMNKNANGGGQYSNRTITSGKRYRLRIINASVNNYIRVSLDSHILQVISSDYVPIKPIYAESLLLGIGQRYDVIITADQPPSSYWFRADVATDCLNSNNYRARAIWTYSSTSHRTPSSKPFIVPTNCSEPSPLTPYWTQQVPHNEFVLSAQTLNLAFTSQRLLPDNSSLVVWALNGEALAVNWSAPTLSYLMSSNTSSSSSTTTTNPTNFPANFNLLPTLPSGNWNYWIIQVDSRMPPIPHPIHLHGHDVYVLGQGTGKFSASNATGILNFVEPTRRDTVTLPALGWLAVAFESDNPGAWLMHCHIAWHVSEGFAVQFLEAPEEIVFPDAEEYERVCGNWRDYYPEKAYWRKDDSGL